MVDDILPVYSDIFLWVLSGQLIIMLIQLSAVTAKLLKHCDKSLFSQHGYHRGKYYSARYIKSITPRSVQLLLL